MPGMLLNALLYRYQAILYSMLLNYTEFTFLQLDSLESGTHISIITLNVLASQYIPIFTTFIFDLTLYRSYWLSHMTGSSFTFPSTSPKSILETINPSPCRPLAFLCYGKVLRFSSTQPSLALSVVVAIWLPGTSVSC